MSRRILRRRMTRGVVRAPSHLPGLSPACPSVSVCPLLIFNASLTHIHFSSRHTMRGSCMKRSARVSVVVDSRATTLQASTCGGLGRDLCDYFGADDLFSWVWRVFDLSDTCHRSLILTQYLATCISTMQAHNHAHNRAVASARGRTTVASKQSGSHRTISS